MNEKRPKNFPPLFEGPSDHGLLHERGFMWGEGALLFAAFLWLLGWLTGTDAPQSLGFAIAAIATIVLVQSTRRRVKYEDLTAFSNAENQAARQHEIQKMAMQMTHEMALEMSKEEHAENQRQHLRWSQIVRQTETLTRSIMLAQEQLRNNPSGQDIINDLMELQRLMRTFDEDVKPDQDATMKTFERMMMARMAKQYGVKID